MAFMSKTHIHKMALMGRGYEFNRLFPKVANNRVESSSLASKGFHFFQFITPAAIEEQRLRLPPKFVRLFGEDLFDDAVLKDCNNQIWNVELSKADGKIWFSEGWQHLIEHHSIRVGYFLVFKYKGNSKFDVLVFDMSCSEQRNFVGENQRNGVDVHIPIAKVAPESVGRFRENIGRDQLLKISEQRHPLFEIIMTATYVNKGFCLIPMPFVKKYLANGIRRLVKDIELETLDGRRWHARCILMEGVSGRLSGWTEFARDNKLKIGDVCKFELNSEDVWKVLVHRSR